MDAPDTYSDERFAVPVLRDGFNRYAELVSEEGIALWSVHLLTQNDLGLRRSAISGLTRYNQFDDVHLIFNWGDQIIRFAVIIRSLTGEIYLSEYPKPLYRFEGCLAFSRVLEDVLSPHPKPTKVFQGL